MDVLHFWSSGGFTETQSDLNFSLLTWHPGRSGSTLHLEICLNKVYSEERPQGDEEASKTGIWSIVYGDRENSQQEGLEVKTGWCVRETVKRQ